MYWKRAVENAQTEFYKIINMRGYADYLFNQGNHEAGRAQYEGALEFFSNDTDFHKFTNGHTYRMWYFSESTHVSKRLAEQYFERAKGIYESISNEYTRNVGLSDLNSVKAMFEQINLNASNGGATSPLEHR